MFRKDKYIIKFPNQTYLTKPNTNPFSNYYVDHATPYDKQLALRFNYKVMALLVAKIVGGSVENTYKIERYELGRTYLTIAGDHFFVAQCKDSTEGYETVCNEECKHHYNRTTSSGCNGRGTGASRTLCSLRYPPELAEGVLNNV